MSPIPSSEAKQLPNVATPMGGFAEGSNKTAVELVDRSRRVRRWCLASADAISLLIGIAVATATGTVTEAHLPWLMASLPVWIFTAKLYDLYDRDHRRIQHSTLGEIPPLLATAVMAPSRIFWLRQSGPIVSSDMATRRFTSFSSSRTLPGQS